MAPATLVTATVIVPYEVDEISMRETVPSAVPPGVVTQTSTVNLPARSSSADTNVVSDWPAGMVCTGTEPGSRPELSDMTSLPFAATVRLLPSRMGTGLSDDASTIGGPGGLTVTCWRISSSWDRAT